MSFADKIAVINNADLSEYRRFYVDETPLGWIKQSLRAHLDPLPLQPYRDGWQWQGRGTFTANNAFLAECARAWLDAGLIRGWRDERYPLSVHYGDPPLALLERAALPVLGIRGYGVHLNGYVMKNKRMYLWIGRRAANKATEPNKLDHIAAGGLSYGYTLQQHLYKEADEEAAIPAALLHKARLVSALRYHHEIDCGMRADQLFVYDLELPPEFRPHNRDGEVATFACLPAEEVLHLLRDTEEFKFNCAAVLIDFFIRHAMLPADTPSLPNILASCKINHQ